MSARKKVVEDPEALRRLWKKIEEYSHNVGTCYRCHNDVEPAYLRPVVCARWSRWPKRLSGWWRTATIKFVPERFTKTYINWMENVHDWCISRQLWWGAPDSRLVLRRVRPHQRQPGGPHSDAKSAAARTQREMRTCWIPGSARALWPFSTMGWPEQTAGRPGVSGTPPACWLPATISFSSGWRA